MKNNKGVTLITVVVMTIVIIIIATTSMIAGNKLLTNSRLYVSEQVLQSVRDAVGRRRAEVQMQGTITPLGEQYVGSLSPLIAGGLVEATGWYMLNESSLKELGVNDVTARFLVNYDKEIVIAMDDEDVGQKYLNYIFMDSAIAKVKSGAKVYSEYGLELGNPGSVEGGTAMYIDKTGANGTDSYGTGWYEVESPAIAEELSSTYTSSVINTIYDGATYLFNFDNYKFVKYNSNMQSIASN